MFKKIKFLIIFGIISIVVIFITLICLKTFVFKIKYLDIIVENTKEYNVDPYLILSVIKAESKFDKNATSKKGACGLMQIMKDTANEIYAKIHNEEINNNDYDIYDETLNITIGAKYLSELIKRYNGNYYIAIVAYNAGIGNVDKWLETNIINKDFNYDNIKNIPFNETKIYTKNVINNYKIYKFLY